MRIVVTGATGNVGGAVLRALAADHRVQSVVGVARETAGHTERKTTFVERDIATDDLGDVLDGADAVVHLAWVVLSPDDEAAMHAINVAGSARVFAAAARAGVGAIVHASSSGAYASGARQRRVDEAWPADGIPGSFYSRHKAAVEHVLDSFEVEHPEMRVVRIRSGLVVQRDMASDINRSLTGPLLPTGMVRPLLPALRDSSDIMLQVVHADDLADAYRRAALGAARGAFNVAADPVVDGPMLARILDARPVRVPAWLLRGIAETLRSDAERPDPSGWLDLALEAPLMNVSRAHSELRWKPAWSAEDALLSLMEALRSAQEGASSPLQRKAAGTPLFRELLMGVGRR